jgi:hypothetical protein
VAEGRLESIDVADGGVPERPLPEGEVPANGLYRNQ